MEKINVCINCDDFGLSPEINLGIFKAIEEGLLGSCSVLMNEQSLADYQKLNSLDIDLGLHFSLTTSNQKVHSPLGLCWSYLTGKTDQTWINQQLTEQLELFRKVFAREPLFIDTHQNIHYLPFVRREVAKQLIKLQTDILRIPVESSSYFSLKKIMYQALFPFENNFIPFWGLGHMGKNFNEQRILNQLEYLKNKNLKYSLWMVHLGNYSEGHFGDSYNQERVNELETLLSLKNKIIDKANLIKFSEIESN
ncbi:MAG: ChbG/HpnK family deacetylase [Halobacteriovoraceae bacterium]|nr:ChbG/HpnK family deacetylase [Halobacteriovoraceae bacterium]MBT5094398.1 ChbG/HpnK family deacetylase [Halobacteriovoraceae bacterium]